MAGKGPERKGGVASLCVPYKLLVQIHLSSTDMAAYIVITRAKLVLLNLVLTVKW